MSKLHLPGRKEDGDRQCKWWGHFEVRQPGSHHSLPDWHWQAFQCLSFFTCKIGDDNAWPVGGAKGRKKGHLVKGKCFCVVAVAVPLLSQVQLFATLRIVACQGPLPMGFSRQECWSGLPCPPPGDRPDLGIKPTSPALQVDSFKAEPPQNAKVESQDIPGVTGKFGFGVQNEAGQRLTEFCQENTLVIANTLFQQHKRRLYTWISPYGQHRNQIDYILCSQKWRSSIQSAKTRPGADCGSDHELLMAKFRIKWKKVGKTTRPFRYDLNQIPNNYTVEVRNKFNGLDLIDRVPDELWTEVCDTVQETGRKIILKKKKCKKAKWLSEEVLQIAERKKRC